MTVSFFAEVLPETLSAFRKGMKLSCCNFAANNEMGHLYVPQGVGDKLKKAIADIKMTNYKAMSISLAFKRK